VLGKWRAPPRSDEINFGRFSFVDLSRDLSVNRAMNPKQIADSLRAVIKQLEAERDKTQKRCENLEKIAVKFEQEGEQAKILPVDVSDPAIKKILDRVFGKDQDSDWLKKKAQGESDLLKSKQLNRP
jgi:hypothetical protein